jgi:hypothetical protein
VFKAGRWVDDMVGLNEVIRPALVRKVLDTAAKRYAELTDYQPADGWRCPWRQDDHAAGG